MLAFDSDVTSFGSVVRQLASTINNCLMLSFYHDIETMQFIGSKHSLGRVAFVCRCHFYVFNIVSVCDDYL